MTRFLRSLPTALAAALVLGLGAPAAASAQEPSPPPADTAPAADSSGISARGAFLRSLVLPGWGQAYVGAPGRGSLYFALESGSLWMAYKTWSQLREARELDVWLRETGALDVDESSTIVLSREEQMEDWITLSLFFLLFSGADAYVSAHLADFDAHVGVRPAPAGGVSFEARVPLGGPR